MALLRDYRVVLSARATTNEWRAARHLSHMAYYACGTRLPIVTDDEPASPLEIVVGKTAREGADGLTFERSRARVYEYEIKTVGTRFYLAGLGVPSEERPVFLPDDGAVGTAYAAYRFAEEVMGCDAVLQPYVDYPAANPDLAVPTAMSVAFTKEAFAAMMPERIEGAAMYVVPGCVSMEWQMTCIIFKTAAGKLILLDGGNIEDTEHVLQVLENLTGGKKPVIEAWLFSHMHRDHFGTYLALCSDPALRERVRVKDFYFCPMQEEFFSKGREPNPASLAAQTAFLASEGTVCERLHFPKAGEHITVDEFDFEVVHVPDLSLWDKLNINDSSVVYRLNYDNKQSFMLLGDAEKYSSADLTKRVGDALKSDVVQVGHHGCFNVSEDCYEKIAPAICLWQCCNRFWYSDGGEGLGTRNTGFFRTREYLHVLGVKPQNNYRDTNGLLSFALPIPEK